MAGAPSMIRSEEWIMDSSGDASGSQSAIPIGALHGVRILVVEDKAEVSDAFVKLLRRVGALTKVATTVDEARQALALHTFDIVLLDLNLNEQSGIPVAQFARSLPSAPVVVVVTGEPGYLDVQRLEELGARVLLKINIRGDLVGLLR